METQLIQTENKENNGTNGANGSNGKEIETFLSFLSCAETKPPEVKDLAGQQNGTFLFSFLTDLVYCIKNTLVSINNFAFLPVEKLYDMEYRAYSQNKLGADIKKVDSVLNSLLNYISINTPLLKKNTMQIILEEILEANEKQLRDKEIEVLKKCEEDLPETFMHSEQVRFILNSLVQFAVLSTPPKGNIGFLIKYFDPRKDDNGKDGNGRRASQESNGGYIVVGIGFSGDPGHGDPGNGDAMGNVPGMSISKKEEPTQLILKLAEEMMQKNRGALKFEVDEKTKRALIKLRFHVERRRSVYYEPVRI